MKCEIHKTEMPPHFVCPECTERDRRSRRVFFFLAIVGFAILFILTKLGVIPGMFP